MKGILVGDRLRVSDDPDSGGSSDPGGVTIPVRQVTWFDERAVCALVLRFLHDEELPDLPSCSQYHAGQCSRMGPGVVCAFHEGPDADVWRRAAEWRMIDVPGVGWAAVQRQLWPEFETVQHD